MVVFLDRYHKITKTVKEGTIFNLWSSPVAKLMKSNIMGSIERDLNLEYSNIYLEFILTMDDTFYLFTSLIYAFVILGEHEKSV